MFPNTITVYRHSIVSGADAYAKQIVTGVYWTESRGIATSGNGVSNTKSVTVVTSKALCDTFGDAWDVQCNDRIVKGEGTDINSFKDIPNSYVVNDVTINQCGSDVDNVTITGV